MLKTDPTIFEDLSAGPRELNQGQSRQCDEIAPMIPAHAIGATDPAEAAHIHALLAECPQAAEELAIYSQMANATSVWCAAG